MHGDKAHARRAQADVLGHKVGVVAFGGIGVHRAFGVLEHDVCPIVVRVDDADVTLRKQLRLGRGIRLHGLVKVQMVLRQVREDAHPEADALHTVQHERVRRHLHDRVRAAGVDHPAQELLQLIGVGRGVLGVQHLVADDVRVRADETDLRVQTLLEHMLDERGDGGLAVRAGHTDHGQLTRRVIEKFAADARERKAAVGHEDIRYLDLWLSLAEHDGRAALCGRADEPVSVGLIPADGGEQVAGLRGARVKADIPDVQFRIGGAFAHVQNGQQSLEFHKRTSVVRQYRPSMPESLVTSVTSTTVP